MGPVNRARALLSGSAMILTAIGVVMIYSASAIYAYDKMGDSAYFLKRHLVYLVIGIFLAQAASRVDFNKLRIHAKQLLTAALILMVLVLVPHVGQQVGG